MKNDNIEELFRSMDFDFAEPSENHKEKFKAKLEQKPKRKTKASGVISLLMPGLAIAASFLVAFLLFQEFSGSQFGQDQELASVSSQMKDTQDFYASVIKKELYNLQQERTPETEQVIKDALNQLDILEKDYEKLKNDLSQSGQDKRVISAMITNFQKRIDLLNNVLEKVNEIKELKNASHENNII